MAFQRILFQELEVGKQFRFYENSNATLWTKTNSRRLPLDTSAIVVNSQNEASDTYVSEDCPVYFEVE